MLDYSSGVLEVSSDSGISCGSVSSSSSLDDDVYDTKKASSDEKPKKIRNVRKSEVHKCVVCGDRPTGYHYDVLSCNGCKTFFRRTIITRRRFVCLRDGKCETSKDCRLSCRACRFIKCVDVGMNPKAIQFDGRGSTDSTEGMGDDEMTVVPMNRGINHEDLDQMKSLDMILHREAAVQTLREDDFPFVIYPDFTLEKLLPIHTALGRKKYHESKKKSTTVEMYTKDPVKFWTVVDLFLTVEFAKTFTEFQTLTSKDRKELMSNVGGPIQMFSQSFYSIKQQSDAIIYPDGMNSINYIFTAMESGPRHEYYYRQNYCRPVDIVRRLDLTTEEFVMLKTIFLFSNETDLADEAKMVIGKKREILVALFRKHLLRRYGLASGTEKLAKCLLAVSTFIEVFEKRRTYCYWLDLTKEMEFATLVRSIYLKDAS